MLKSRGVAALAWRAPRRRQAPLLRAISCPAGRKTVRPAPMFRQPLRVHGWKRRRLSDLRLSKHAGRLLQAGRNQLRHRRLRYGRRRCAYGIFSANATRACPRTRSGWRDRSQPRRACSSRASSTSKSPPIPRATTPPRCGRGRRSGRRRHRQHGFVRPLAWFPAEEPAVATPGAGKRPRHPCLKRGYVAQYDFGKAFVAYEASPDSATAIMQKLRTRFGQVTAASLADEAFAATDTVSRPPVFFRKGRYRAAIPSPRKTRRTRTPRRTRLLWPKPWPRRFHSLSIADAASVCPRGQRRRCPLTAVPPASKWFFRVAVFQHAADEHDLAEMVGVVVRDQERFPQ